MRVRRCVVLFLEPSEAAEFDLAGLMSGGAGARVVRRWLAHAPHLPAPVTLDPAMHRALDQVSARDWSLAVAADEDEGAQTRLREAGLVLAEGDTGPVAQADARLRGSHWWGASALLHYGARWGGRDAAAATEAAGLETIAGLQARLGPAPPAVAECGPAQARVSLMRSPTQALDRLLQERTTCRNFQSDRPLPLEILAQMLERSFGAHAHWRDPEHGALFLKKGVPSGGGLHPTEAYLIVKNVDGLAPGLYHYHPLEHALQPMPSQGVALDTLSLAAVAGQHWFADAPVLVVMASRFLRCFWKYRGHPKAYRAITMDVGHLSQTLYLSATDLGLGAFVTCAINEADLEQAFGLDPYEQGVMAVSGFGWRRPQMSIAEFDPGGQVWQQVAAPEQV